VPEKPFIDFFEKEPTASKDDREKDYNSRDIGSDNDNCKPGQVRDHVFLLSDATKTDSFT
jgi:hypothetical protein